MKGLRPGPLINDGSLSDAELQVERAVMHFVMTQTPRIIIDRRSGEIEYDYRDSQSYCVVCAFVAGNLWRQCRLHQPKEEKLVIKD